MTTETTTNAIRFLLDSTEKDEQIQALQQVAAVYGARDRNATAVTDESTFGGDCPGMTLTHDDGRKATNADVVTDLEDEINARTESNVHDYVEAAGYLGLAITREAGDQAFDDQEFEQIRVSMAHELKIAVEDADHVMTGGSGMYLAWEPISLPFEVNEQISEAWQAAVEALA